jgi:hypothetical protein
MLTNAPGTGALSPSGTTVTTTATGAGQGGCGSQRASDA